MTGADQFNNMIHFHKNVSIMGGFLLLYVAGPGKYSVDATFGLRGAGVLSGSAKTDW
jgi:putative oxidoreductase